MPVLRGSLARQASSFASSIRAAARKVLEQSSVTPSFPVVPTCPAPTCVCTATPPDLDIERSKTLNGTMAAYAHHVLVSSGQHDWKSKIEDERDIPGWGQLTAGLKRAFGRGGRFHNPYHNVLISTSSFNSTKTNASDLKKPSADALLFPSFIYIKRIPTDNEDATTALIEQFLLPGSSAAAGIMRNPTILICSHATRDSRCGILGPLLQQEFASYLRCKGVAVEMETFAPNDIESSQEQIGVNVGLLSHIGGHKWAGNVILYIPPIWKGWFGSAEESQSKLAGMGIWYGRVEPKHVEGIVEETLVRGRVIKELFRGAIGRDGQTLRI